MIEEIIAVSFYHKGHNAQKLIVIQLIYSFYDLYMSIL